MKKDGCPYLISPDPAISGHDRDLGHDRGHYRDGCCDPGPALCGGPGLPGGDRGLHLYPELPACRRSSAGHPRRSRFAGGRQRHGRSLPRGRGNADRYSGGSAGRRGIALRSGVSIPSIPSGAHGSAGCTRYSRTGVQPAIPGSTDRSRNTHSCCNRDRMIDSDAPRSR